MRRLLGLGWVADRAHRPAFHHQQAVLQSTNHSHPATSPRGVVGSTDHTFSLVRPLRLPTHFAARAAPRHPWSMQRMNGLLSGLARTFSSDLRAERQNALRSVPSFNEFESHSSADLAEQQQEAGQPPRSQSLPPRFNAQLHTAASVTDSETSFSVGSPAAAGSIDSPTAAAAEAAGPAKQPKQPYKIHGMDAYDYWSLIKSL